MMISGFLCKYDIDVECVADKCDKCKNHPMYQQGIEDERPKAFAKGYDSGYQQGRADGIDAFFKTLNRDNLIRNENDLIIASMLAEQLKEQKDEM